VGCDFYFYLQKRTESGWEDVLPDQAEEETYKATEVFWLSRKNSVITSFFLGENAVFPLIPSEPPGIRRTDLYTRQSNEMFDGQFKDWAEFGGVHQADVFNKFHHVFEESFKGWLEFESLEVDQWDERNIYVSTRVQARYATVFGDGKQGFPRQGLRDAGLLEEAVDRIQYYEEKDYPEEPIDRTYGKGRFELEGCSPDYFMLVTWVETFSKVIGEWITENLKKGRAKAGVDDADLRLICYWS